MLNHLQQMKATQGLNDQAKERNILPQYQPLQHTASVKRLVLKLI
jgi:hypothetical protein